MSEYKHTVAKTQMGGFSQSPDQETSNAGGFDLDSNISARDAVNTGVAVMYGKKVSGRAFSAVTNELGNAQFERSLATFKQAGTYLAIARFGSAPLAIGAIIVDGAISVIDNAVERHAINLQNTRLRATTGVRVTYNGGGYYG